MPEIAKIPCDGNRTNACGMASRLANRLLVGGDALKEMIDFGLRVRLAPAVVID